MAVAEDLLPLEKEVILVLEQFPAVIADAATEQDPSKLAIYIFNLAKTFNSFYTVHSIIQAETGAKKRTSPANGTTNGTYHQQRHASAGH